MSYLKELKKNIDAHPFTGNRNIEDTKVICRGKTIKDTSFGQTSMLGKTREDYYKRLKKYGITPEKEYVAIGLEGYGDVFDIIIKENDFGKSDSYMSIAFDILE